jgi:hypothetical protein
VDDKRGRAVNYESDSDYLILTIYLLFSMCCMRLLYLETPEPQHDKTAYVQTSDDPWELASR